MHTVTVTRESKMFRLKANDLLELTPSNDIWNKK